ncbi:MAG: class II D-tagatose-bisphosphate aldolase non-catalytic subunit [Paracoccaceae bacterium]
MAIALGDLAPLYRNGTPKGITSVCSAHPLVLRAALRHGRDTGATVLIEATCNQVNHLGGYTGMQPADFATMVSKLAQVENCPTDQIILGGDHLGPNPWRKEPVEMAMQQAKKMVAAYIKAGFRKIHLDASMGCKGEAPALDDATTAQRSVQLALVAESTAKERGLPPPFYIIGTEVPPPGGADHALTVIEPTSPMAARHTLAIHKEVFEKAGLAEAFTRVIGLVVQPGVEFGNQNVIYYESTKARDLIGVLDHQARFIFEAHSTDYQGVAPLAQLVKDGFSILKVGPELTFVLRETLYALDLIASDFLPDYGNRPLYNAMENLMLNKPEHWASHYDGDAAALRMLRHYSLSDRIRYYWATDTATKAVERLTNALRGRTVPTPLIWQYLPGSDAFANIPLEPEDLIISRIINSLKAYHTACNT